MNGIYKLRTPCFAEQQSLYPQKSICFDSNISTNAKYHEGAGLKFTYIVQKYRLIRGSNLRSLMHYKIQ